MGPLGAASGRETLASTTKPKLGAARKPKGKIFRQFSADTAAGPLKSQKCARACTLGD